MKYIMMETAEGAKMPILFPEALTHIHMAAMMQAMMAQVLKTEAQIVSAGFVALGKGVVVHGESESLGGLPCNPADAARIVIGEAASFMGDEFVAALQDKLKRE